MQEKEFFNWLKSKGIDSAPTYIGKIKRIEKYHGNIDDAYNNDNCQKLLSLFKYSQDDAKNQKPALHEVPIDPKSNKDIYQSRLKGTQDLFTRINRYVDFRNSTSLHHKKNEPELNAILNAQSLQSQSSTSLNRIFYGPPGTGKTYHTINAALEVLIPEKLEKLSNIQDEEKCRKAQKEAFNELLEMGRISFVTFHQSFSYEDFVEGIRPIISKTDQEDDEEGMSVFQKNKGLTYDVVPGIFRKICELADSRTIKSANLNIDITDRKIWKMALGRKWEKHIYDACIDEEKICMGFGGDINFNALVTRKDIADQIIAKYKETTDNATLSVHRFVNEMSKGDIVIINDGLKHIRAIAEVIGEYEVDSNSDAPYRQMRKVRWLKVFNPSMPSDRFREKELHRKTLYLLNDLDDIEVKKLQNIINERLYEAVPNNYVLIIDEINRGNISGIFGELITLIEPSKRLGAKEELKVTLPYSRDTFGVPNNLYIIGTMNTADRSLTGLDIALRRRFTFIEMPPDYGLLEGKKLEGTDLTVANLLLAMNERIEFLLGRDYCLGHATFMHLKDGVDVTVKDLKPIFKNTIIPLLQEYFFEDWRKIHLILNDHKKDENFRFIKEKKPSQNILDDEEFSKSPRRLWEINKDAFEFLESYIKIVK